MSAQGLQVLERTVHETHEWLNELADRLDWTSHRDVLSLLRSVLRGIRDHLPNDEMAQFSAQLPIMLRGMYFEGWQPKNTPVRERHAEQFIAGIEERIGSVIDYRGPADIGTVFVLINARISTGEVNDIRACLPAEIKAMWPAP